MEKKKAGLFSEFGPENFKIQTICKNRTKNVTAFEQNGFRIGHVVTAPHPHHILRTAGCSHS